MSKAMSEGNTPLYYAGRGMVWKRPVETVHANGTKSISLGFPICTMHEACEGQEDAIAELLNRGEQYTSLLKALDLAEGGVCLLLKAVEAGDEKPEILLRCRDLLKNIRGDRRAALKERPHE